MFKFIHVADVHLDSSLRGLSRYESTPTESIRNACRRAFENLVDLAIEEKVSFVLLAGDLYDGDWKDYNVGIFLASKWANSASTISQFLPLLATTMPPIELPKLLIAHPT